MNELVFFIAAPLAILSALGVALLQNPFYSVLSLVAHLCMLSVLFLLLNAQFLAAVQVLVYVGAVMVLYVFVNAYVGSDDDPRGGNGPAGSFRAFSYLTAALLAGLLGVVVLGSGVDAISQDPKPIDATFGGPATMGKAFLTDFLFAFEASSFLLLVAAVGAVVLARRRETSPGQQSREISVIDLLAPTGTGSMREGVGAVNPVPGAFGAEITPSVGASAPALFDSSGDGVADSPEVKK